MRSWWSPACVTLTLLKLPHTDEILALAKARAAFYGMPADEPLYLVVSFKDSGGTPVRGYLLLE